MIKIQYLATLFILNLIFVFLPNGGAGASGIVVHSPEELKKAVSRAAPGDTILLENKEWKNAALILNGKDTAEQPILIMPQTMGGVQLNGSSYLAIGGEYLTIKGLHFKNGYTPVRNVITFRINNDLLANHCWATESVIDECSQPARIDNAVWVVLWDGENRVYNCLFFDS